MKVEVKSKEDDRRKHYGCLCQELWIDGKRVLSVYPLCECPEDAIIGRSLVSCDEIASLMKRAHAAGNEPFDLTETALDD